MVSSIQQLILLGKGDRGRLEYILEMISNGRTLPLSDQKYLEGIIPLYLGPQDTESVQSNAERSINDLYGEIRSLDSRLEKFEHAGFERYIGRKAIFFFATVFVAWHAFQGTIYPMLGPYVPEGYAQYLFPLNVLAGSYGEANAVWLAFVVMALAWPFIGAIHLARFVKSRKIRKDKAAP